MTAILQKMAKVKASDKLSFPISLSISSIIRAKENIVDLDPEEKEDEYELAAILFHKGPSASHGHYGRPLISLQSNEKISNIDACTFLIKLDYDQDTVYATERSYG